MLLDEDPATLIHETTLNFNTAPDKSSLARIAGSLSTLSDSRSLRLSQHQSILKRVARQLATIQAKHELNLASNNPAEHAQQILALDTQKFKIAKEASDLEIEAERLESEVLGTEALLREVEAQGVEGGAGADAAAKALEDIQTLKLKLYRGLGVDIQGDLGRADGWKRALVRNERDGSAKVVEFEEDAPRNRAAPSIWAAI